MVPWPGNPCFQNVLVKQLFLSDWKSKAVIYSLDVKSMFEYAPSTESVFGHLVQSQQICLAALDWCSACSSKSEIYLTPSEFIFALLAFRSLEMGYAVDNACAESKKMPNQALIQI